MRSDLHQRVLELESEMADVKDWILHDGISGNDEAAADGQQRLCELQKQYAELMDADAAFV